MHLPMWLSLLRGLSLLPRCLSLLRYVPVSSFSSSAHPGWSDDGAGSSSAVSVSDGGCVPGSVLDLPLSCELASSLSASDPAACVADELFFDAHESPVLDTAVDFGFSCDSKNEFSVKPAVPHVSGETVPRVSAKTERRRCRRAWQAASAASIRTKRTAVVCNSGSAVLSASFAALRFVLCAALLHTGLAPVIAADVGPGGGTAGISAALSAVGSSAGRRSLSVCPVPSLPPSGLKSGCVPPPGWKWASVPVDTGCTNNLFASSAGFSQLGSSRVGITSANGDVTAASAQGTANIAVFDSAGRPSLVSMPGSLVAPSMTHLLSVNDLRAAGIGCYWPPASVPYLQLPSGGVVHLRFGRDRLWYLDYLQAVDLPASSSAFATPLQSASASVRLQAARHDAEAAVHGLVSKLICSATDLR